MTDDDATVVMGDESLGSSIPGYEIIRTLGRGGMGMVYLARQLDVLDREVALKTVLPVHTGDVFRSYFLKEGQRQAQLHHPNILPIFAAGEAEGTLYLSMYYARDGSLRERIDEQSLSLNEIVDIGDRILSALQHAHSELESPMAHLDVKPENILFDGENVFLADFGIATSFAEDATVIAGTAGDPRYWPPEQQIGEASTRSDLYAFGLMFYELLTGTRPGADLKQITSRQQVKALADSMPSASRACAPVIGRCLHPDPAARPDASEVREELRQAFAPKKSRALMIVALVTTLAAGALISQPVVRLELQEAYEKLFPRETFAMKFTISPDNGRLWLDGQEEALRSVSLKEGEHRMVVVAEGYVGQTDLIQVEADKPSATVSLDPIPPASDGEYLRFFEAFDGSTRAYTMDWSDPTLQNLILLDRLEKEDQAKFREREQDLVALAGAGDAVAATTLFYAAFEGIEVRDGPKALMQGLISASDEGYAVASLLRALFVLQSLLEAGETFNKNPYAFEEVATLLTRAAQQGLPEAAERVATIAGIGPLELDARASG